MIIDRIDIAKFHGFKDSGYLRYPVIYLSLKRLIPIGEEPKIHSKQEAFTDEEIALFKETLGDRQQRHGLGNKYKNKKVG